MRRLVGGITAAVLLTSACQQPGPPTPTLNYLGQVQVAASATFSDTVIGGLSGISYDPERQLYYIVSDDRSTQSPARFYTAQIPLSDTGSPARMVFTGTHAWLDTSGRPFGPLDTRSRPPVVPPDAEGIAVDGRRQRLYWSSEGERRLPPEEALLDPWVRIADLDGGYVGEFRLPAMLKMSREEHGPRRNNGLEGLTLSPDGASLWAAMEGPGYDDGDPADTERGAVTRVTKFDVETRTAAAQYAYPLDPVTAGPGGDNGLSDLVALDADTFLVVERGFGDHVAARIFLADIGDADDVLARPSLATGAPVRTMTKSLVADLTTTPGLRPLDNVEGITLGPRLPDGRQSVVLVSDDNFSPGQITQVLVFAL